ncbi:hypothetical protein BMIN10S_02458 [Bosea minatitlanensis]
MSGGAPRNRQPDPAEDAENLLLPGDASPGRWLDLGFRLIILGLAVLWLLMPAAGATPPAPDGKAIATTR